MPELPESLYIDRGDHFESTVLTRGPWSPGHQHAGPPAALLTRALEQAAGIEDGQFSRLSYEILAPVPIAPLRVEARPVRPGRRVELLEARITPVGSEQPVMLARGWRLARAKTEPAVEPHPSPDGPEHGEPAVMDFMGEGAGYHDVIDWRFTKGGFHTPGPAAGWTRMRVALVEGEEPTPMQHLLVMADAGNGISSELSWDEWLFVNVDLSLHLQREPEGEWIGIDARTRIGATGMGVANSVIFDAEGRVATGAQSLLVAPRPPGN
jgi:hypothetical protein